MSGQHTIFIFADSVSLPSVPRAIPKVSPSQTWSEILKMQLAEIAPNWEVIKDGKFNRTTTEARQRIDEIAGKGDVVVFQLGINDSSPRVLLPNELAFMSRYFPKYVQYYVQGTIHLLRVQIMYVFRGRVYTNEQDFETNVQFALSRLKELRRKTIFVGIAPTHVKADRHNPGMIRNIARYNEILRKVVAQERVPFVDVERLIGNNDIPECISKDGAHLSPKGHAIVAESVAKYILPMIEQ